ncbi:MAG TPA: TonB-dependent receptor [Bryobacteraceae bacterium]|nr:TonB-dependent receptor [Bryobacteraceae bacterium]
MKSAFSILIFMAAALQIAAAPRTPSVSGTVYDPSGSLVSAASVTLHQVAGSALLTATSDHSGHFAFTDVAPGQYLLEASAPGLVVSHPETITIGSPSSPAKELALHLVVSAVKTQVSVTAAGEPQSVDEISKALDVVTAQDAEARGLFQVADALRLVPGLRISTRGSPGAYTTIQTRGLRITDTAILIDDFPFRDVTSVQDEASAYIGDLTMVDVSRVEDLRGSGSSLYGSNAMSGVVNIITGPGGGPIHGELDVQGGGLGLFHGVADVSGGAFRNRLTYSAGISHLNVTDGVDDVGAVRNWGGHGGILFALTPKIRLGADVFSNTGYVQENVSPEALLTAPEVGIVPAIGLNAAQRNLADANQPFDPGAATFYPSLGDPDAGVYSHFVSALFRFEDEVNSRLSYRIGYGIVDTNRNNTNGPGGPSEPLNSQTTYNTSDHYIGALNTVRARVDYIWGAQVLTAGYEFQQEHYQEIYNAPNPDPTQAQFSRTGDRQRSNAGFAQDELRFLNGRLDILLSGRYTHFSVDQPVLVGASSPYASIPLTPPPAAYTGDAAVSYYFSSTATKVRAHAGNSYRAPSLYERFGGYIYGGYDYNYGDPRLSPERAVSLDFGFDEYLLHQRLKISSTYFYEHLQQVIGFLGFPPGFTDPYGRSGGYYNTGGGISRGVELSGEYRPNTNTTLQASYTYTNALDRQSQYYTGTPVDPLQTPRILPNTVTLEAIRDLGHHIDVGMDFTGGSSYLFPLFNPASFENQAYRFPGPRQLGLMASYTRVLSERLSARFYVRVSNTLNQSFYEDGFLTPRRWATGGIHFSF